MNAQIKVESYNTSMWGGFERTEYLESTYQLGKGACIDTVGLGRPYCFKIVGIRPGAVELCVRPELVYYCSGKQRYAGALTLEVGDTITLQTMSFDAWGNWIVSLKEIF